MERGSHLFDRINALLDRPSSRLTLQGAVPSCRTYLTAGIRRRIDAPILVVTADSRESARFSNELQFFLPADAPPLHFPAWEVLPFEPLSPSPEISAERIATLDSLLRSDHPIVVAPIEAALHFLVPKGRFAAAGVRLRRGDTLNWQRFFRALSVGGYHRAESVEVQGEYSRRGGILDFFPPSLESPVRVELFGEEVESLRLFDPETQRSREHLEELTVLPAREILLDTATLRSLRGRMPGDGEGPGGLLEEASYIPGLEHYQATLTQSRQTILDYFSSTPLIVVSEHSDLELRAEKFRQEILSAGKRATFPDLFAPEKAYLDFDSWTAGLREHTTVYLDSFGLSPPDSETLLVESSSARSFVMSGRGEGSRKSPLEATIRHLKESQARESILLVAHSAGAARRLTELCAEHEMGTRMVAPAEIPAILEDPKPGAPLVSFGPVPEGFRLPEAGLLIVTEEDIFGAKVHRKIPKPSRGKGFLPDFHLLKPGDFIVHVDHGIGVYGGVARMPAGGEETDFLVITYQGGDKIYVPSHGMDAVQRYVSWEGNQPRIDRLGGKFWPAAKRKAKKALVTLARDLLRLYAIRQSTPGYAFSPDTPWQREFEMGFEYAETEDQLRAIEEIKADMEQPHPMDRLVCGDVGYGKTEVAMRAAFKAVMDSRQVAVLAPTTILVQQHISTFRSRLSSYPLRVEMLSRFVRPAEQKKIVRDLAEGKVDIVIGTHRLLGRDVRFRELGLVIIDEEQRFGVRHKDLLKEYRKTVDVLSLTATPVPRTLYLSLSGIRELSQISTPPENRLAVRNTVARFDAELVREAVRREIRRGGQVFFIHNRVHSIEGIGAYLQRILPEIRIGIAHGQMSEKALDDVMTRFRRGEIDLLLSTTIVESGLDIPNANTMIVNRADSFGLAELYQLRGRIGRSRHRAYAYFLIRGGGALSPVARRRIEVIRDFSHLGAGFQIALYDLEIRGAGSVLGYRQSGHIAAIGFDLYGRLLRETIRELQGEPAAAEKATRATFSLPTYIPEEYMDSINQRLTFYKKVADAETQGELDAVAGEMRERYGILPPSVEHLLRAAGLKLLAEELGVKSLKWGPKALEITFYAESLVSSANIAAALKKGEPGSGSRGGRHLSWKWKATSPADCFEEAYILLQSLR
jgi:transcription-repair coupling factor (superfamily II helicase)